MNAQAAPVLRAIKCSERMPTREDANDNGCVRWELFNGTEYVGRWNDFFIITISTHWHPLNRSAIATDAEEQRGEGGE